MKMDRSHAGGLAADVHADVFRSFDDCNTTL